MLKLELSLMFKGALWVLSSVSSVSGNHNFFFKLLFHFYLLAHKGISTTGAQIWLYKKICF